MTSVRFMFAEKKKEHNDDGPDDDDPDRIAVSEEADASFKRKRGKAYQ